MDQCQEKNEELEFLKRMIISSSLILEASMLGYVIYPSHLNIHDYNYTYPVKDAVHSKGLVQ